MKKAIPIILVLAVLALFAVGCQSGGRAIAGQGAMPLADAANMARNGQLPANSQTLVSLPYSFDDLNTFMHPPLNKRPRSDGLIYLTPKEIMDMQDAADVLELESRQKIIFPPVEDFSEQRTPDDIANIPDSGYAENLIPQQYQEYRSRELGYMPSYPAPADTRPTYGSSTIAAPTTHTDLEKSNWIAELTNICITDPIKCADYKAFFDALQKGPDNLFLCRTKSFTRDKNAGLMTVCSALPSQKKPVSGVELGVGEMDDETVEALKRQSWWTW
ncbi:hypothetical protein KY338_00015 [Candidatus Woesearchaeota archaeon]|nr:hypothetical protein [Candidatus Woesearchaeota archaeon]MBW3005294.1 hypothetical protein [Candidatus Woesearchaeota archaeon]